MNAMKSYIHLHLHLLGFALIIFSGCDNDDVDVKHDSTYPVSGEWVVNEFYEGDPTAYGPYHLQIFKTAASDDSVWISNIYGDDVKVRALVNPDNTFRTDEATDINEGYAHASVLNGKIVDNDSIYFEVVLYALDDNGNPVLEAEYVTAGRRWTGLEGQ